MRLTVELVPETSWFSNLRSELPAQDWDRLRRQCYKQARYRCQVCGGRGSEHPVECHELWHYDDHAHVQSLAGVVALCPACHEAKHIGSAAVQGHAERARGHLAKVNRWDAATLDAYLDHAFSQWQERSQHGWELDITHLREYGIEPPRVRHDRAGPSTILSMTTTIRPPLRSGSSVSRTHSRPSLTDRRPH